MKKMLLIACAAMTCSMNGSGLKLTGTADTLFLITGGKFHFMQVNPKSKTTKKAVPAKVAKPAVKALTVLISVMPEIMQYDKKSFTVKAGQKVIIELENPDGMQHNFVLIKAGALDKVGLAADEMAKDPKGAENNYVPDMPEVLHATKLLNPQESITLQFTAPSQPGDYPYVCTFPGHWRIMKGVMKVVN